MLKIGLNDCTNEQYHADREFVSSSGIKLAYKSLTDFYDQYILNNRKKMSNEAALLEGSLTHTLILEPELLNEEFAFFPDWTKKGAHYEAFVAQNPGKKIISEPQKHRVDEMIKAFKKHPVAPKFISGGVAEQTICDELEGTKVKIRTDYINPDQGYIADVKTTGYPGDRDSFEMTLKQLCYELSGALYLNVAEKFYGKPFVFYFIVLSKKDGSCNVYKLSQNSRTRGERMVFEGLKKLKNARETGTWQEQAVNLQINAEEILEV